MSSTMKHLKISSGHINVYLTYKEIPEIAHLLEYSHTVDSYKRVLCVIKT